VTYVGCDGQGLVDPADIQAALTPQTKLIALVHASNVTGAIQPVEDVGRIARSAGIPFLVDAAQSLGYVPVAVGRLGCDLLAAPGHKGLLGPLGTGMLYVAPGVEANLLPLKQGGTGTRSDQDEQPDSLPDRYESGNLNVAGIAGLEAGVTFVLESPADDLATRTTRLLAGLSPLPGVTLLGPPATARRVGVVSLNVTGYDPQELAALLDANWRIQTRAGIHCAPRMHAALRTAPAGTLRLSPGHFTTSAEIDAAVAAFAEIAAG
jgi:selenocysteine lyase/cysteine desulfurase